MGAYLAVFIATLLADVFWAKWTTAVARQDPFWAGIHAALIILAGGFTIVEYTNNHWLLIPAMLGAYCGTYFVVKNAQLDDSNSAGRGTGPA